MTTSVEQTLEDIPTELFINGEWCIGTGAGGRIQVVNPATEEVLAEVSVATPEDGLDAVVAAAEAGPRWAARSPRQRAEILLRAFELMTHRTEQLAQLIVLENGKAAPDARSEVAYAAEFFRWYAEEAVRNEGSIVTSPAGGGNIVVLHQPIGVSLLVTPWNFPAAMATRKIAPALAAGCSVVLKPASETPLTALAIAAILHEAGVPAGVVNVLPSASAGRFVNTLLDDDRVRKLSFTGSTEVGRLLLAASAGSVVDCSMELGGNAPFIVFDDADVEAAIAGAMVAKMRNGGQACTAANRFYVARSVASEFTDRLSRAMSRLVVGPGWDTATEVGPLINRAAQQDMSDIVTTAVKDGAALEVGGAHDGRGFYYQPSVLSGVEPGAAILRKEIFGPLAPIVAFGPDDDVVAMANDTEHGLAAYVYTQDLARSLRVAEALEYGMVGVNRGLVSDPAAPFGGVKQSGLGREGGREGMREFTESKYVNLDWSAVTDRPGW
jgi:succinate-semialdehyde dehydrogenase / glutarate-semialdehyde dehydrogenase